MDQYFVGCKESEQDLDYVAADPTSTEAIITFTPGFYLQTSSTTALSWSGLGPSLGQEFPTLKHPCQINKRSSMGANTVAGQ